jgi:hypothetical protein
LQPEKLKKHLFNHWKEHLDINSLKEDDKFRKLWIYVFVKTIKTNHNAYKKYNKSSLSDLKNSYLNVPFPPEPNEENRAIIIKFLNKKICDAEEYLKEQLKEHPKPAPLIKMFIEKIKAEAIKIKNSKA